MFTLKSAAFRITVVARRRNAYDLFCEEGFLERRGIRGGQQ